MVPLKGGIPCTKAMATWAHALRHCFNDPAAGALPLGRGLGLAVLIDFTLLTTPVGVTLFRRME